MSESAPSPPVRVSIAVALLALSGAWNAGNIGPVMDALRADSGDAIVLVTPAFPETGHTVYQGNLFVGSVPLNESPLKDHPLNPMHDSNLVRVLARQSRTKVGLVDLATLSRGVEAVRDRLAVRC